MNEFDLSVRSIYFHAELESATTALSKSARFELTDEHHTQLEEKLHRYSIGKARRNADYKFMAGFSAWKLIELRWDFHPAEKKIPVRLIGTEIQDAKTTFLVWHFKNLDLSLDEQRIEQNKACEIAIERMYRLANTAIKL